MMWLLYALLSALTASLVAIFSKLGSTKIDSVLATTLRSVIMTLFLLSVSLFLKRLSWTHLQTIPNKDLTLITLSGIAGALSWLFYFSALKIGNVSGVVAVDRLSLVFAVVLAVLVFGETITAKAWLGVGCMTVGAFLIVS